MEDTGTSEGLVQVFSGSEGKDSFREGQHFLSMRGKEQKRLKMS